MYAEKISKKELGPLAGNYWRLLQDDGTVVTGLEKHVLPSAVKKSEDALTALQMALTELSPEVVAERARIDAEKAAKQSERRDNLVAKALRKRLLNATDVEIDQYVNDNIFGTAQTGDTILIENTRAMFKQLLKIIAADMRED